MVDIVFIGRLFLGWNKNILILGIWSIFDNLVIFILEDMFFFVLKRWVIFLLMIELKEWIIGLKIMKVNFFWGKYMIFICC